MDVNQCRSYARDLKSLLGLGSDPVGVILDDGARPVTNSVLVAGHRYCQALMRARRGEAVTLEPGGIACPAAARAFGFKGLPEGLRTGNGLVSFGIVSNPEVGKTMFERMPRLEEGSVKKIHLFPAAFAERVPDVIVIEDDVERLMWIVLACLHVAGGERVRSDTAVLQAACVDATIIPFLENRPNMSFGCYGCRDATDVHGGEALIGFPARLLGSITDHLEYLARKAMPQSREKGAFSRLAKPAR
jgi:uncharacterized protein (DUF169 family)